MNAYFTLGSYQVIVVTTMAAVLLAACCGWDFPIYLLNGVLLPLFFAKYGVQLNNYWVCLAALLLLRKVFAFLYLLDVTIALFRGFCLSVCGTQASILPHISPRLCPPSY